MVSIVMHLFLKVTFCKSQIVTPFEVLLETKFKEILKEINPGTYIIYISQATKVSYNTYNARM